MTILPEFIDNRDGNTLQHALRTFLGLSEDRKTSSTENAPDSVRIATAYFNPTGYALIADQLQTVSDVRLLLGTDPAVVSLGERRKLGETPPEFQKRQLAMGLRHMDHMLCRERDRLPFTITSNQALRRLIDSFRSGNIQVRRYDKSYMHAKAYIISPNKVNAISKDGMFVGSSNLTSSGLARNLELNLGRYDGEIVEQGKIWFDQLWDEATPYDLAAVFEKALAVYSPWDIFIRVLWILYGSEVEIDVQEDDNLPLTNFQKHGVVRALRLLGEMGGVIVADEVGLGKTFIAGEILQHYRESRQRTLLICPASLRDTTWKRFLSTYQLFIEWGLLLITPMSPDRPGMDKHPQELTGIDPNRPGFVPPKPSFPHHRPGSGRCSPFRTH